MLPPWPHIHQIPNKYANARARQRQYYAIRSRICPFAAASKSKFIAKMMRYNVVNRAKRYERPSTLS